MIRKALLQINSWAGICIGLYVVLISETSSLLVFRIEYYNYFRPGPTVAVRPTARLTKNVLKAAAERRYPALKVTSVQLGRRRTAPDEVVLSGNGTKLRRLFDPYTGEDLGQAEPRATKLFEQVSRLHDDLLGGPTGRTVNGVGGLFLTIMSLSGPWIWRPGLRNWRRVMIIRWTSNWKRFSWDLHSAMGFWLFSFVFMWAITSIYMVFPDPFLAVVDYLQPPDDIGTVRMGDTVLEWFAKTHFGRPSWLWVKIVWGVVGLVPPA